MSAALKTYQAHYLKELKAAKEEGRSLKEFGDFIKEVNRNHVYMSSRFAEKIHPAISRALGEVELVFSSSIDQERTVQLVKKYALMTARKEVKKVKAQTILMPLLKQSNI